MEPGGKERIERSKAREHVRVGSTMVACVLETDRTACSCSHPPVPLCFLVPFAPWCRVYGWWFCSVRLGRVDCCTGCRVLAAGRLTASQLNIASPATGSQMFIEIDDEKKL